MSAGTHNLDHVVLKGSTAQQTSEGREREKRPVLWPRKISILSTPHHLLSVCVYEFVIPGPSMRTYGRDPNCRRLKACMILFSSPAFTRLLSLTSSSDLVLIKSQVLMALHSYVSVHQACTLSHTHTNRHTDRRCVIRARRRFSRSCSAGRPRPRNRSTLL